MVAATPSDGDVAVRGQSPTAVEEKSMQAALDAALYTVVTHVFRLARPDWPVTFMQIPAGKRVRVIGECYQ